MKMHDENYESPIESMLAERMKEAFHDGVECWTQRKIVAHGRKYRADFYLECDGSKFVIEADGQHFHDSRTDWERDANMLDSGVADDVIRFTGKDIYFSPDDCIEFIRLYARQLVDPGADPLSADEFYFQSLAAQHLSVRGCIRSVVSIESAHEHRRMINGSRVCVLIGTARKETAAVVQVRVPDWMKVATAPRAMLIGDYMRMTGMASA